MPPSKQAPFPLCMLICDAVQQDRGSGKTTIFGAFADIISSVYPARHPELTIYAELTGGHGQTPITVKLCRTTADSVDGEELYSMTLEANFPDPRHVSKLILKIAPFDIPQEGEYRFILETEGTFIIERRLVALITPPKSKP